ncbi:MAG: hypothetical protein ACYCZY_11215 [Lacisediminihabitans sp.]
MSEPSVPRDTARADDGRRPRGHPLVILLAVLLFLECALLATAAVYLIVELVVARPDSYASAVAILVLTALAAVWLGTMAVHTLRSKPWIRGGAFVWQVLQIAIAVGSFQGLFARADIGWFLIVPAVLVLVLLFTPPVVAATKRAGS